MWSVSWLGFRIIFNLALILFCLVPTASCICGQRFEQAHGVQDPRLHQSSGGDRKTTRFHWKLVETSRPAWLVVFRLGTGVRLMSLPVPLPHWDCGLAWPIASGDYLRKCRLWDLAITLLFHLVHASTYPAFGLGKAQAVPFLAHSHGLQERPSIVLDTLPPFPGKFQHQVLLQLGRINAPGITRRWQRDLGKQNAFLFTHSLAHITNQYGVPSCLSV